MTGAGSLVAWARAMKTYRPGALSLTVIALMAVSTTALAQTPAPAAPPPPPGWTGSASAGLALTSGNSDNSTVNAAYEVKRDTGGSLVFKSTALLVWGKSEGELTSDRLAIDGRVERKLNDRTSFYTAAQYLRDSFKAIDYLVSPTVGLTRLLAKTDRTEFGVDAGIGVVMEKDTGFDLDTDGAITGGQHLSHKLTATTELKQKAGALWVMDDFGDALYTFGVGLAASISTKTQMKAEFLDTYKAKPPFETVQKNDIAVLLSFVYKFE